MGRGVARSGNRRARTGASKRDGSQRFFFQAIREIEVLLPASRDSRLA